MKTWFKRKPVENLEEWLKIATKDLCESAKTRITIEIEAHYKEALEAHLTNGESLDIADALALQELGAAEKAARRFRKKHLTEEENEKLEKLRSAAFKPYSKKHFVKDLAHFFGFLAAVLILRQFFFLGGHGDAQAWSLVVLILTTSTTIWIYRVLATHPNGRSVTTKLVLVHNLSQIILAGSVSALTFLSVGPAFASLSETPVVYAFFGCLIAIGPYTDKRIVPWLRIWQKVRRNNSGWEITSAGSNPTSAT